eukprot:6048949-Prymnesium_polylepis.1
MVSDSARPQANVIDHDHVLPGVLGGQDPFQLPQDRRLVLIPSRCLAERVVSIQPDGHAAGDDSSGLCEDCGQQGARIPLIQAKPRDGAESLFDVDKVVPAVLDGADQLIVASVVQGFDVPPVVGARLDECLPMPTVLQEEASLVDAGSAARKVVSFQQGSGIRAAAIKLCDRCRITLPGIVPNEDGLQRSQRGRGAGCYDECESHCPRGQVLTLYIKS